MGDTSLSQRQRAEGQRFQRRLHASPNLILDYRRESAQGFFWRERTPGDGTLIVAWPKDESTPANGIELLEMPVPPPSGTR
ncbi:hypothetical protein ACIQXD_36315 [Streptomyces uncialis]|uniref:hypothetical protein n=1 Tax=Streptomyces uncialis TaxID=1048205 RepID=UPI00380DAC06